MAWSPSAAAFVALVQVGANQDAYRSVDGRDWTRVGSVPCCGGLAVSDAGLLVATGSSLTGACVATSDDDGASWTPRASGTTFPLRRVAWTGGEFLAVGGTGRLLRSPDGVAWTTLPTPWTASPNAFDLNDIAALPGAGGRLLLVGSGGLVATSP